MIDRRNRLKLFYKDGANPAEDFSREVADFGRDSYSLTLKAGDTLYVGFNKPINSFYVELSTASAIDGTISITKETESQGTVAVEDLDDDTRNFQRSGFIQWDRDETSNPQVSSQPEVGMPEAFWLTLTTDTDTDPITIQGWNIVFADDQDLERIVPCITDAAFLQGKSSHILQHVSARDEIIQRFRNKGLTKRKSNSQDRNTDADQNTGNFELFQPWDLLDIHEVRQGAAFLAVSKIFFNLSDEPDDVWNQKSLFYRAEFEKQIEIAQASFDIDDDGRLEAGEGQRQIKFTRMPR